MRRYGVEPQGTAAYRKRDRDHLFCAGHRLVERSPQHAFGPDLYLRRSAGRQWLHPHRRAIRYLWLRFKDSGTRVRLKNLSRFLLPGFAGILFAAPPPGMLLIPGGEYSRGRTFEWKDYEVKWYPNPAKDDLPVKKISSRFHLHGSERSY